MVASTKFQTDYELQNISISVPSFGSPVDVKPYMVELNLYEDIFGDSVSGNLLVSDALGLLPNFRLNGTEFITVALRKNSDDGGKTINRTFRIYKVSDRYFVPGNNYENYTINFCSEELMISEKYRISKSYKNKTVSQMVSDILTNHLKVGNKKMVSVENTTGTFDFVLPNKRIFETINWLSTYAMPSNKTGGDMLFFENVDGFWFKSLQSLYAQKSYMTYYFNPKNVSSDMQYKYTNIISMDVLDSFDMLNSASNGTFSNRLISIDPLTRTSKITDFDYNEYCKKSTKMNSSPVTNNYKDRIGKKQFEAPPNNLQAGNFRLLPTNSGQRNFSYIKSKPQSVFSDYSVEKTVPYRAAQMSLANFSRIKITVPGNAKLSVGMTINVVVPQTAPTSFAKVDQTVQRQNDPYLSGKYLITAVRHIINLETFATIIEICKESNDGSITGVPDSWNRLSQG